MTSKKTLEKLLKDGDHEGWREFLSTADMNDAVLAHVEASKAEIPDMRRLAFKRVEHLNGEHRHPEEGWN